MENFWTSNKPINGLRHFVLVNEMKSNGQNIFLMVSVIDSQINLTINKKELLDNGNWEEGWLNLPKNEAITENYFEYKSLIKNKGIGQIFISEDSLFNIK